MTQYHYMLMLREALEFLAVLLPFVFCMLSLAGVVLTIGNIYEDSKNEKPTSKG